MERAERRTADVHRRGKRQLEREIAELKRAAAAETPAAVIADTIKAGNDKNLPSPGEKDI